MKKRKLSSPKKYFLHIEQDLLIAYGPILASLSVCLLLFPFIVKYLVENQSIASFDVLINSLLYPLRSPVLNSLMGGITFIGNWYSLGCASLLLLLLSMHRKKTYAVFLTIFGMLGGILLVFLTKMIIARPRPTGGLISAFGYSFPSAHAAMSLLFFYILIIVFKDDFKTKYDRKIFSSALILFSLLIGVSRIYLGVHYASDVLFGYLFAILWLSLLYTILHISLPKQDRK